MRKSILFAVAGIGAVLAGCNASNHRYQMIPVDDPAAVNYPAVQQPRRKVVPPAPPVTIQDPAPVQPEKITPPAPKYTPMTGAVSTGGVDKVTTKKAAAPRGDGKATVHVVKKGEYPGKIARMYGISTVVLLQANNMDMESAKRLRIGQKLTIPARTNARGKASEQKLGAGKHRIQKGENPSVIAKRYKIKVADLLAANGLDDNSAKRLRIGQILTIPGKNAPANVDDNKKVQPDNKKQPGGTVEEDILNIAVDLYDVNAETTYAALASQLGEKESLLRALNGNDNSTTIPAGSVLMVPQR